MGPFAIQLFRVELTILEVLSLFLRHVSLLDTLLIRLSRLVQLHLPKLLFLQRESISQFGLLEPVICRAVGNSGWENKIQGVHFFLDLRKQLLKALRYPDRGTSGLGCLGCSYLLPRPRQLGLLRLRLLGLLCAWLLTMSLLALLLTLLALLHLLLLLLSPLLLKLLLALLEQPDVFQQCLRNLAQLGLRTHIFAGVLRVRVERIPQRLHRILVRRPGR